MGDAPLIQSLALFVTGLVAGTLNAIAGGGSMLTLPVMIFLGLPPTVANGTNRVAVLTQSLGGTWSFARRGLVSGAWVRLAVPATLVGAVLGTLVALRLGDVAFQRVLAGILVVMAALMIWRPLTPSGGREAPLPDGGKRTLLLAGFFMVGFYGGFIQAGAGFLILSLLATSGLDLVRSNAVKLAVVLAYTPLALFLFARSGSVDWLMGAVLAAGTFFGALLGVRLQILKGQRWVRGVVTAVIVVFAVRLLVGG